MIQSLPPCLKQPSKPACGQLTTERFSFLPALVAQVANDTATVDDAELVASTVHELEAPHVRALAVLGEYKQQNPDARPLSQ
jgi:hypothetical protein